MTRRIRHAPRLLVLPLVVGVLAGCGSDEPPSAAAPELADALSAVDDALSNRNYARAENALDRLVGEAEAAEADGDISDEQAGEIVDAAEALAARLPDTPEVDPSDDPITPAPTETPPPEDEDEEEEDDGEKEKEEKDKGKNGNGHNGERGPDGGR